MKNVNVCENCNKEHDGSYGSGRFCSEQCARSFSTKAKRKEINRKVSEKLSNRKYIPTNNQKEALDKLHTEINPQRAIERKKIKRVKLGGDILNITQFELDEYRKTHKVCDICGNPEITVRHGKTINLSIDHDHVTKKFRGVVCNHCNTKLAWLDKYKETILHYITAHPDVAELADASDLESDVNS